MGHEGEASGNDHADRGWCPDEALRSVLDGAPVAIVIRDREGRYLYANDDSLAILGITSAQVTGNTVFDVFPHEVATRLLAEDHDVLDRGVRARFEADLPTAAGTERTFVLAKYPVRPEPDGPTFVATIGTDITELKDLQAALAESELRFRQLTEGVDDVFVLTSLGGQEVLYISPNGPGVFGLSPEEHAADAMSFLRLVHPADIPVILTTIARIEGGWDSAECEYRLQDEDRVRWMRAHLRRVEGPNGEVRVATMITDISADRALEADLERARRDAEVANQRKSEFLSAMSHELRTPLHAILGFSQLLELESDELEDHHLDSVLQIRRAGRHLLDLINEVLDFSRIERGMVQLSIEPVDIGQIARETCELLGTQAAERSVSLHDSVVDGTPILVRADRQRLTQVLINLVINAIKYNDHGGRVDIVCSLEGERTVVEVVDTGPGMSNDDMARLFTPFERLGRTQSGEGSGIGLALSRQLVEAMGGRIDVRSRVGMGTTFRVELPVATTS